MSEADIQMEKAIKSMYHRDVTLLALAEIILICVLSFVLYAVFNIAPDSTVQIIAVVSYGVLALASAFGILAVIQHLKKNHMALNREDIENR